MSDAPFKPPERDSKDLGHTTVKAVIASVPFVGGAGAEFFSYLLASPVERRKDEWAEEVGAALRDLTSRVTGLEEKLQDQPNFVDVALQASQVALRNSAREKRDALRNAVLNAALKTEPNTELEHLFVRLIDELSPQQLQILELFEDPRAWNERHGRPIRVLHSGGLSHVVESAFPQLGGQRFLYDQLWKSLFERGLVNTEHLHTMMTGHGLMESRLTELGQRFLRFVRRPEGAG